MRSGDEREPRSSAAMVDKLWRCEKMAAFVVCRWCGAHLDHGEQCECRVAEDVSEDGEISQGAVRVLREGVVCESRGGGVGAVSLPALHERAAG